MDQTLIIHEYSFVSDSGSTSYRDRKSVYFNDKNKIESDPID